MKTKLYRSLMIAAACILLFSACPIGYEPAWKDRETSIALTFPVLADASFLSSNRAIVQGGGYLYIRTIGGPTGTKGPYYGPYRIDGHTFTTSDIPAGTYEHMAFIYAADNMDAMTFDYNGAVFTFPQLLKLPDAEVVMLFSENENGPEPTEASETVIEEGSLSMSLTGETIIKQATINPISVTLLPNANTNFNLDEGPYFEYYPAIQDRQVKKFIRLSDVDGNLPAGETIAELICQMKPSGGPAEIGILALYDDAGKLVKSIPSTGAVADGVVTSFSAPYTAGSTFFLYIEYRGPHLKFEFSRKYASGGLSTGNVSVSIGGATAYAGKTLGFGLYPTADYGSAPAIGGGFQIAPDGTGHASARVVATGSLTIPPGNYYLFVFIDVDGDSSVSGGGPDIGDMIQSGTPITVTPEPVVVPCVVAAFAPNYPGEVYNVANETQLASQITLLNANAALTMANPGIIVLSQSFTVSSGYNFSKPVIITSSGGIKTLTLSANMAGSVLSGIANVEIILDNTVISGVSGTYNALGSLVSIPFNGIFTMMPGSALKNNTATSDGGGVRLTGATFNMKGGEISGCNAGMSGGRGGGVYNSNGVFYMSGGSILNNATTGTGGAYGGGVAVTGTGSFTMTGGSITQNSTSLMNNGGGVYFEGSGIFSMSGGSITANTAAVNGGGVYLVNGTFNLSGGTIFGNTASVGGGLYKASGTFNLTGSGSVTGNTPTDIYP